MASKGLYYNINKRKKAGTSRSKEDSTISPKAYKNMLAGFPKKKKQRERYKGAYPVRDVEQSRLIDGQAFSTGLVADFANPIADGSSIDIAIAFPQGIDPVFTIAGLSNGNAVGYLYEGASVTGGTSLPIINRNRASTITSTGVALANPTVNSLGNVVLQEILTAGVGKKGGGNEVGGNNIILKGLTTYLFRLTNADGNNNPHAMEIILSWTE